MIHTTERLRDAEGTAKSLDRAQATQRALQCQRQNRAKDATYSTQFPNSKRPVTTVALVARRGLIAVVVVEEERSPPAMNQSCASLVSYQTKVVLKYRKKKARKSEQPLIKECTSPSLVCTLPLINLRIQTMYSKIMRRAVYIDRTHSFE